MSHIDINEHEHAAIIREAGYCRCGFGPGVVGLFIEPANERAFEVLCKLRGVEATREEISAMCREEQNKL